MVRFCRWIRSGLCWLLPVDAPFVFLYRSTASMRLWIVSVFMIVAACILMHDGLQIVHAARRGASLSVYDRVLLDSPVAGRHVLRLSLIRQVLPSRQQRVSA